MMTKTSVVLFSLTFFFIIFIALITPNVAIHAAEEIGHPFFQSEDFKRLAAEQTRGEAEIESLQREQRSLMEERNSYSFFGAAILNVLLSFFSINQIIVLSLLSIPLIVLYLLYLKRFNQAKWYLMFKTKNNLNLLFKSMKQFNKIIPLLCFATVLCPGICYSGSTSLFEDVKLFLSGDEIKRNYVLTKYPKRVNTLNYSRVKDIFVYKSFEDGSFEQNYDFLVHKYAIGVGVDPSDLLKLIEKCRTLENLTTTYGFIVSLDDDLLRKVASRRLEELAKLRTSTEFKLKEAEIIIDKAKEKNKVVVVKDDILLLLNKIMPNVSNSDVGNIITLSALMLEFDPSKSLELYTKVRYSFEDIFKTDQNKEKFRKVFASISQTNDINNLYDLNELRTRVENYPDRVKVLLGAFFDGLNEQVAGTVVRTIQLDKVTFSNPPELEQLATLIKRYRPSDSKALYERLVADYCKTGNVSIPYFAGVASALGYDRDQTVDDIIRKDLDMYANQDERSVIINKEFLSFLSDSQLERYMDYLKKRPQHARLILGILSNRKYDLFLDYLDYMYLTYPARIADSKFENKLVRFDRWTNFISRSTLASFSELPFYYFLADREATKPTPDFRKISELTEKRLEQLFQMVIKNDKKLDESDWVHALILYHLFKKASDPGIKEMTGPLEEIIRLQLVDKLNQQRESQNGMSQRLKSSIASLNSELSVMRAAKYQLYFAVFLAFLIAAYILVAFIYSIKYSINAVLSYTGTRIALFCLVFAETMAKFLLPVLHFTVLSIFVIMAVQLYAFLRSKDGAYPNTERALTFYQEIKEG